MPTLLWSLTALELVEGYRRGTFTPLDASHAVLDRLHAVNGKINAVIAWDADAVLRSAAESAERWKQQIPRSPLDGVPISVKDNLYMKGLRATWGSKLLAEFVPDEDEPAVARLRNAGLVLLGKTNVPEFTIQGYTSNAIFGTTFNPHALGKTPGGSTGGGAAAVAAGIGPLALGTDGGGSIRRPAAHCGLFALKPTIGHIARYGGFPQILSDFEVIGLIARTAADLEALRGVLVAPDPLDPRTLAASATMPAIPAKPRVAYMPAIADHPVDPAIAAEVRSVADALRDSGAEVETVAAPFDYEQVTAAWGTVMTCGLAWYLSRFPQWRENVNSNAQAAAAEGAKKSTQQLLDALSKAAQVRMEAGEFFSRYDLLLSPAAAALAWPAAEVFPPEIDGKPVGPRGHAVFTAWMNVAGVPAVTVPLKLTSDGGGIGLQLAAAHGRDRELSHFVQSHPVFTRLPRLPLAEI